MTTGHFGKQNGLHTMVWRAFRFSKCPPHPNFLKLKKKIFDTQWVPTRYPPGIMGLGWDWEKRGMGFRVRWGLGFMGGPICIINFSFLIVSIFHWVLSANPQSFGGGWGLGFRGGPICILSVHFQLGQFSIGCWGLTTNT
jgi:hypothetical protein